MGVRRSLCRAVACFALALAVLGSQGCSRNLIGASGIGEAVRNYWLDRATDLLDVVDLGFSFSEDPRFSLYADELSLLPLGFGLAEGHALGIGGGNIGYMRYAYRDAGALFWGYEGLGFGGLDKGYLPAGNAQAVGLGGLVTGPYGRPGWQLSSVHHIHIICIGVFANANWLQAIDLPLGIVGLDICGDDGYRYGLWPWESEPAASAYASDLADQVSDPPTGRSTEDASFCWGRSLNPLPGATGGR